VIVLVSIFGILTGILRVNYNLENTRSLVLNNFEDKNIVAKGLVLDVDKRQKHDIVTFRIDEIEKSDKREIDEKIIFFNEKFPELKYGDLLEIEGQIKKPGVFETETGRDFDYGAFLKKDDIYYEIFYPKVVILGRGQGNSTKEKLLRVKDFFVGGLDRMIKEPESGLLEGLLLGSKRALSDEWIEKFRLSGLVHMIVLSGYNITVVSESVMKFLTFLWPAFSVFGAILSIIFFAIMTGASATTVRASIMALIAIFGRRFGRKYFAGRALIFAGFLMVMHNPKILAFDFSFQLSFLATIAIIFLSPKINKRLSFVTERFGLREIISSTIATQIFVAPILLYRVGELSVISLISNILVLGLVPSTMFFGFITGLLGNISEVLAWPFSLVAYILLKYEMKIADWFSAISFGQFSIDVFPIWVLIISYIALSYIAFFWKSEKKNYTLGILFSMICQFRFKKKSSI
jgi:competence protein ComEC